MVVIVLLWRFVSVGTKAELPRDPVLHMHVRPLALSQAQHPTMLQVCPIAVLLRHVHVNIPRPARLETRTGVRREPAAFSCEIRLPCATSPRNVTRVLNENNSQPLPLSLGNAFTQNNTEGTGLQRHRPVVRRAIDPCPRAAQARRERVAVAGGGVGQAVLSGGAWSKPELAQTTGEGGVGTPAVH